MRWITRMIGLHCHSFSSPRLQLAESNCSDMDGAHASIPAYVDNTHCSSYLCKGIDFRHTFYMIIHANVLLIYLVNDTFL